MVGFTTEHKAATFGGMPLDATLDTKEITNRMTGRHLSVNSIRPEIDGENVNVCVQVGSRDTAFGNISYSAPIKANSLGECNMKERARYMRFRIVTRGNFRHATGVAVEMRDGGKR